MAQQLAEFAVQARTSNVPKEVAEDIRRRILDVLGIAAAANQLDTSVATLGFISRQASTPQAGVIGLAGKTSVAWAAFGNGVLAHSLDYDDTHLPSILHPSAAVVPAGLAVAEAVGADSQALLDAVAAGIETTIRLGMAGFDRESGNSLFFEHGQHATSICGTVGAAVTAALLSGLPAEQVVDAIGIACSMAAGILEGNRTGGTVKRVHCGWAAHAGVTAAQLAQSGITGPPTALEGRFGLLEAFGQGRFRPESIDDRLGVEWETPQVFFKPYPANHFTHTAADGIMALRSAGLQAPQVERIRVGVATPTVRTIGQPIEVKRRPRTGYQAQFSGPYVVAAALLGGGGLGLSLEDFTDHLVDDPVRQDLMDRVEIVPDPDCDAIYPYQFPARVEVTTKSGDILSQWVPVNRGGGDNPLTAQELARKFHSNAGRVTHAGTSEKVQEKCGGLGSASPVADLVDTLNQGWSGPLV